jgi:tetratricopeptide (TPR) repeat protein
MTVDRLGSRQHRARVAAAALAVAWSFSALALPNDAVENRDKARAVVAEGARLYGEGKFNEALSRYSEAYALFPSPKIQFNMALAYRDIGRNAQAFVALERFLRDATDASPELLASARAEIGRLSAKVGFVTVTADAAEAEVLLVGVRIGSTPLTGRTPVDGGRHDLVLRAAAYGSRTKAFTASAGKTVVLRMDFRTEPVEPSRTSARAPRAMEPSDPPRATSPSTAAQAEAHLREATELRRAGKDARAYPLFQRAYETETTPRTAAQLGLVEIQLGYWLLAERHLTESLSAPRDPWVASNRADLEASLAKVKAAIGEIVVTGSPAGATVLVNGKASGALPIAMVRSGEGPANVEVRAPGHASVFRSLTVVGGRREELSIALEKADNPSVPATGPAAAPGPPGVTGLEVAERTGPPTWVRSLAWASAGLAVATAGFGAYQTLVWRKKFTEFEDYRAPAVPGMSRTCGADEPNATTPLISPRRTSTPNPSTTRWSATSGTRSGRAR